MTDIRTAQPVTSPRARTAGLVCAVAGVLGTLSAILLAVVPPAVPFDVYSHPFDSGDFALVQTWFAVQHGGLLGGIAATAAAAPGSRLGRVGAGLAVLAMLALAGTELWAIAHADATYPSAETDPLDTAYGVCSLVCGLGLVMLGVAVARSGRRTGWRRWVPLATGVWAFVPMTPLILAGFVGGRVGIGGWMLLFAALGWALATDPGQEVDGPTLS